MANTMTDADVARELPQLMIDADDAPLASENEGFNPDRRMRIVRPALLAAVEAVPTAKRECEHSPTGRHIVDTSMESGPNNCFHCEQPMPRRGGLGE